MFSLFKNSEADAHTRAKAVFEKIVEVPIDNPEARSMRVRVGLLSRAFLDATFIEGAEKTDAYEMSAMLAISQAKPRPEPPVATEYQTVQSTSGPVVAYLPMEYAEEAFSLGALYQKTEISAEQAISAMQTMADKIFLQDIKMAQPFQVLQFLREEVGMTAHILEEPGHDE